MDRREHRIDVVGTLASVGTDWTYAPVVLATSGRIRRIGLRPLSCGVGLVLAASSVHGFGMAEDLTLVGVAADGVVVSTTTLRRGAMVRIPGVRFVVELPQHAPAPAPGDRLLFTRAPDRWVPGTDLLSDP